MEPTEIAVLVLEVPIVLVTTELDVSVLLGFADRVERLVLEEVLETIAVPVKTTVDFTDFVEVELGDGRTVPISERVGRVVFVEVFDCVEVELVIAPESTSRRSSNVEFQGLVATEPMAANKSNQRISLLE